MFQASEQPALLALPAEPYELAIWATPKVAADCHIPVDGALYSVPFRLVGRHVDVRSTPRLVEVFVEGKLVKTHQRHQVGRGPQRRQRHRQTGRQGPVEETADRPIDGLAERAAQGRGGRPGGLGVSTSCHQHPAGSGTARSGRARARRVTAPASVWSPSAAACRWQANTGNGARIAR
jgi:hypothetical protein